MMTNYPNEKKERNKELLADTLNGISMLDRIVKYRISSVRIGLILKREVGKIMKGLESGNTSADFATEYNLPVEKIEELVNKEKAKLVKPQTPPVVQV